MCWSFEVAIVMSVIELLIIAVLAFRKRIPFLRSSPRDRLYALVATPLFFIEFLEIFIWGDLSRGACGMMNKVATSFAYLSIVFQPTCMVAMVLFGSEKKERPKFWISMLCSCVWTAFMIFIWVYDWIMQGVNIACSKQGETGHLYFGFHRLYADQYPTFFSYFFNIFVPILFLKPVKVALSLFFITTCSAVITISLIHPAEFPSSWCFAAIVILLYMLVEPYLFADLQEEKVNTKNDVIPMKVVGPEQTINV